MSSRAGRVQRAMRRRTTWVLLVAVVAAALGVPVGADAGGVPPEAGAAPATNMAAGPPDVLPADGHWAVTLLSGEVVDVRSDSEGRVFARPQARTRPVRTVRKADGELYVFPSSVTPLLHGVLDAELFNVTGLVRQGFDDASTDVVPLIVQREGGADVLSSLSTAQGSEPLPSIGGVATEVPKSDARATGELLAELRTRADAEARSAEVIGRVWLDRRVTAAGAGAVTTAGHAGQAPALDLR